MSYTDKELLDATQIAYINFNKKDVDMHPDWTIRDHFLNNPSVAQDAQSKNSELYNAIMDGKLCQGWKIADYHNTPKNGFSACCIDTGDGSAIVGYRGSEDAKNPENLVQDWIRADGGLINSIETSQQKSAREYLEYIYGKRKFDSMSITGHSLGGNLAEHAAITASDECYGKIDRVLNLDGPGYSDEYLVAHGAEIKKHAGKIDHYQFSPVGAILNALPGTKYQSMLSEAEENTFDRHRTQHMVTDANGNMIPSEPDDLSVKMHAFTNTADDGTTLPGILSAGQMLFLFSNPVYRALFKVDFAHYMNRYKKEAHRRYQETMAKREAKFMVNTEALVSSSNITESSYNNLKSLCDDVQSVKSQLSVILKIGAFFALTCKLHKIIVTLEHCSTSAKKMSNGAEQCANLYTQCENTVISI